MESLVKNNAIINTFHNESKMYQAEDKNSDKSSLGSVSSAEQRDCDLLFKGEYRHQFEALKDVKSKMIEKSKRTMAF